MSKKQDKKPSQMSAKEPQKKPAPQPTSPSGGEKLKEWLISLLITLVVLGIVVALQYWFAKTSGLGMNGSIMWGGNAIGGFIMLFIVHHFVKKPKDDGYRP